MKELQLLQSVLNKKGYKVELTVDEESPCLNIWIGDALIGVWPENGWRCELQYFQGANCLADGLLIDPVEIIAFCETVKELNEFI